LFKKSARRGKATKLKRGTLKGDAMWKSSSRWGEKRGGKREKKDLGGGGKTEARKYFIKKRQKPKKKRTSIIVWPKKKEGGKDKNRTFGEGPFLGGTDLAKNTQGR